MEQGRIELKQCYQAIRKILQNKDLQDVVLPRSTLSCLASVVISDLGAEAANFRQCLTSTAEDEVSAPRGAMMVLMRCVAKRLSEEQPSSAEPDATVPCLPLSKRCDPMHRSPSLKVESPSFLGRVLVVGAGATGTCAALRLRSVLGSAARIEVWEKARGAGGRMSTNRQDSLGVRADMGAPVLSLDMRDVNSAAVAELLLSTSVCKEVSSERLSTTPERPRGEGWRHFAGTEGGVNDALKRILDESRAKVFYEKRLGSLDLAHKRLRAKPFSGSAEEFDAVLMAVPGCGVGGDNLNKIHGGWERMLSTEQNKRLLAVQHDQRWTFALFFPMRAEAACDRYFGAKAIEMMVDDGMVHLLCYQSRKTSLAGKSVARAGIAIVAHTTIEWAKKNSRANGRDQSLLNQMAERVKDIIGIRRERLLASKVITWKQCQVTRPIPVGPTEGPCMKLSQHAPLILAGDYFTESNFTGCIRSAFAAADTLADVLQSPVVGTKRSFDINEALERKSRRSA